MKCSKEVSSYSLLLIFFIDSLIFEENMSAKIRIQKIFQTKIKSYEVLGSSLLPSSLPSTSYRGYEVVDPEVDYQVVRGLGWEWKITVLDFYLNSLLNFLFQKYSKRFDPVVDTNFAFWMIFGLSWAETLKDGVRPILSVDSRSRLTIPDPISGWVWTRQ